MKATKKELRQEIQRLRHVGQQFSNMAFNWSQGSTPTQIDMRGKDKLRSLYKEWDSIGRAERP